MGWLETLRLCSMVEIAKPWKSKQVVGPHVVEPEHSPVTIGSSAHGLSGEYRYRWVCKYCDEAHVAIEEFGFIPTDCDGVGWLESEKIEYRDRD